jgi:hypothetical protein
VIRNARWIFPKHQNLPQKNHCDGTHNYQTPHNANKAQDTEHIHMQATTTTTAAKQHAQEVATAIILPT